MRRRGMAHRRRRPADSDSRAQNVRNTCDRLSGSDAELAAVWKRCEQARVAAEAEANDDDDSAASDDGLGEVEVEEEEEEKADKAAVDPKSLNKQSERGE